MYAKSDIELDNLRHPEIFGETDLFFTEDYDLGAISMLKMIAKDMGWEESERHYYKKFFENNQL